MSEYFPKQKSLGANGKVELDLSYYATKAVLKNATGVDTSDFAKKTNFSNLKSDVYKLNTNKLKNIPSNLPNLEFIVDQLDIEKLERTLVDLSKLSDAIKNDAAKTTKYDELVKKINSFNAADTSGLV